MRPAGSRRRLLAAAFIAVLTNGAGGPAGAAQAADPQDAEDAPEPTPLVVDALKLAWHADLAVEATRIGIAIDRIEYEYKLRNKGSGPLALSAGITLPTLENDSNALYALPAPAADNPVALSVTADGNTVATTPYMRATALDIDRLADLQAEHLPLVPFSADTEKALAAAKPETVARLSALGLASPSDPTQPNSPLVADWALDVTRGWTQTLEPGKTTVLGIGFAPIKASYTVDKTTIADFYDLTDEVCLTPKIKAALKALFKPNVTELDLVDIMVATDRPVELIDSAPASISVRKPNPDSIVAFCGQNATSADPLLVTGATPTAAKSTDVRVLIFTPARS